MSFYSQTPHRVRLEWGMPAAEKLASEVDCVIVVDLMSFSTCVSVAVEHGVTVYPFPWKDERAARFAKERDALLAGSRSRFAGQYSLSPQSLLALPAGVRLVLPSPNGSSIAFKAREYGVAVFSACLRNLQATADACRHFERILLVPCGERWPDNSLRPALEDHLTAGAIIAALDIDAMSAEAQAARLLYESSIGKQEPLLRDCASARELIERGYADDVELCLRINTCQAANRLLESGFAPAGP